MTSVNTTSEPNIAKPKLIVFDLDYTLWPFWIDTHVNPPFIKKGDKVLDTRKKAVKHYPEVPELLNYLQSEGFELAIASRTAEIKGAEQLLELFDWNKYFKYKEIYPGPKVTHFESIKKASCLEFEDMLFFDDENRNIRDITEIGVVAILVNSEGMTKKLLSKGLLHYQQNR